MEGGRQAGVPGGQVRALEGGPPGSQCLESGGSMGRQRDEVGNKLVRNTTALGMYC